MLFVCLLQKHNKSTTLVKVKQNNKNKMQRIQMENDKIFNTKKLSLAYLHLVKKFI